MQLENIRIGELIALSTAVFTAVWVGGVKLGDIESKVEVNSESIQNLRLQIREDQRSVLAAIENVRLESKQDRALIIQSLDRLEQRVREAENR